MTRADMDAEYKRGFEAGLKKGHDDLARLDPALAQLVSLRNTLKCTDEGFVSLVQTLIAAGHLLPARSKEKP